MENEICHLKVEDIIPKNYGPPEYLNDYMEQELVASITKHGIIQPIVVKKNNDKYEIIDGNRRYFAALKSGLPKIPAIVRNTDNVIKVDLRQELYNQDLSPIEEAKKYKEILETSKMSQEELANSLGKSQSALANKLRLLNLPMEIQDALDNFEISERHARSLLTVKNKDKQLELLAKIKENRITVRELDSEIKNMSNMFIPEEFSNSSNNMGQGNGFIPNQNNNFGINNSNQSNGTNTFIPSQDNSFNQNIGGDNAFMPNQDNNMFMPTGNVFNANQLDNTNNAFDSNYFNNTPVPPMTNPNNNMMASQPPYFTNNDYMAPVGNSNENTNNSFNPFASIRNNTNNLNNDINNVNNVNNNTTTPNPFYVNNEEIKVNQDEFNINDYKLPGYEESPKMEEPLNQDIQAELPKTTEEFKYVEENPNYVSVDKPVGVASVDDVINVFKEALNKIKNGKIKVDTEEIDYDDSYQITIRIDKKGDFL